MKRIVKSTDVEWLKVLTEEEVKNYIREALSFDDVLDQLRHVEHDSNLLKKEHRRFNMTGFHETILHNFNILNTFIELGIYDHVDYLYLKFYKGIGILYLKSDLDYTEVDLGGYGTTEIIYRILKLTVL